MPGEVISLILSYHSPRYPWKDKIDKKIISSKRPAELSEYIQQKSIDLALTRIKKAQDRHLINVDLSRCGLNRINKDNFKGIFSQFSNKFTMLSLKSNGLNRDMEGLMNLIKIVREIPEHITHLDLSDNGLEAMTTENLKELFSKLPSTIQYITLELDKPLTPTAQIAMRNMPTSYKNLISNSSDIMQQALAILEDYTKGDSAFCACNILSLESSPYL